MTVAVASEDILGYGVTLLPRIVYVEVRRRGPFRIYKPLEVKVQVNRVNICDFQAVSYDGVSPATASYVVESARH